MGAWSQNTPARGVLYSDASVRPRVESNRHRLNVNGGHDILAFCFIVQRNLAFVVTGLIWPDHATPDICG